MVVRFDGRPVQYDHGELDEVSLAYAVKTHKSQGSEFPAVVIPRAAQQYVLLQRNLIYTGITWERRLVVVIGQRRVPRMAVSNNRTQRRYSGPLAALRRAGSSDAPAQSSANAKRSDATKRTRAASTTQGRWRWRPLPRSESIARRFSVQCGSPRGDRSRLGVAWGGHDGREVWPGGWHLAHVARRQVVHYEGMRPGIVLENALGSHLFSGETGKGREWLKAHCTRDKCEWVGKFLSVDDEDDARDLVDAAVADGFDVME